MSTRNKTQGVRALEVQYDELCEVIGRLDRPVSDRLQDWKLRNEIEAHLIEEGVLV